MKYGVIEAQSRELFSLFGSRTVFQDPRRIKMLKTMMLVSAIAISAPVIAQDMNAGAGAMQQQQDVQRMNDLQQQTQVDQDRKAEKKAKKGKKTKTETAATTDATAPADATASTSSTPAPTGDVSADAAATAQTTPQTGTIPGAPVADPASTAQTPTAAPVAPQASTPAAGPATATAQAAPAPAGAATASTAQPAAGAPVTGAQQIAQVINTEFPTYDKNTDGNLDKAEFAAWMVTLKKASDPATNATAPETVQWVSGAFAQADKDKSSAVSKAELTSFLTQGQS